MLFSCNSFCIVYLYMYFNMSITKIIIIYQGILHNSAKQHHTSNFQFITKKINLVKINPEQPNIYIL